MVCEGLKSLVNLVANILKLKSLGQIVDPQNFTETVIKDGKMISQQVSISGRRFPIEDIRKNLLTRHTKYMRKTIDEQFGYMELNEV